MQDMNIKDNLIETSTATVAAVVLALAVFITTKDVYHEQSQSDQLNAEGATFDTDQFCDPCPNNSPFYHIGVIREGQEAYMFVDLVDYPPGSSCCNVIAKPTSEVADQTDVRVNFCRNISAHDQIEIISFVHINSLVGVEEIAEGYNLSLQVRGEANKSQYQMIVESAGNESTANALAFMLPDSTDKYYIIPQWKEDVALLTIHKNASVEDRFVFEFMPSIPTEGTIAPSKHYN